MAIKERTKSKSSDIHAGSALLDTEKRPVLDSRQTGRYLGVTQAALRLWREKGGGPPFFKAGPRLIRYRRSDLDQWIAKRIER